MRNLLLGALLLVFISTHAQQKHQYKGVYELQMPYIQNATAKYSYVENNGKEEKEGAFELSFVGNGAYKGYNAKVNGTYHKGLKHGFWNHSLSFSDWRIGGQGNSYATGKIALQTNYKNGQPDGKLKFSSTIKGRKKNFTGVTPFSKEHIVTLEAEFNNGNAVRFFSFRNLNQNSNTETALTIEMDERGFLRRYESNRNGKRHTDYFENGLLKDEDFKQSLAKVKRYEFMRKNHPDSLEHLSFSIDTLQERNWVYKLFQEHINWQLFMNDIKGDLFYESTYDKAKFHFGGFYYLSVVPRFSTKQRIVAEQNQRILKGLKQQIQLDMGDIGYNESRELQVVKKDLRELDRKVRASHNALTDALLYFSGKHHGRMQYNLKNYLEEYELEEDHFVEHISIKTEEYKQLLDKLLAKKLNADYAMYIKRAELHLNNREFKKACSAIEAATKVKAGKEATLLKEKLNYQQICDTLNKAIVLLEMAVKMPPENVSQLSKWQQTKLSIAYGQNYYNFSRRNTFEAAQLVRFPQHDLIVEKIVYTDKRYYAPPKIWNKNSKYLYQGFRVISNHYRLQMTGSQDYTKKSAFCSEMLGLTLELINIVGDQQKCKNVNKELKKIKNLDDIIVYLTGKTK